MTASACHGAMRGVVTQREWPSKSEDNNILAHAPRWEVRVQYGMVRSLSIEVSHIIATNLRGTKVRRRSEKETHAMCGVRHFQNHLRRSWVRSAVYHRNSRAV